MNRWPHFSLNPHPMSESRRLPSHGLLAPGSPLCSLSSLRKCFEIIEIYPSQLHCVLRITGMLLNDINWV